MLDRWKLVFDTEMKLVFERLKLVLDRWKLVFDTVMKLVFD